MNQFLIGIIIVLGLGGYWLYNENITLKANNLALEGAIATQQEALDGIYPNDNTKTISDLITDLSNNLLMTEDEVKDFLKSANPQITDWSF